MRPPTRVVSASLAANCAASEPSAAVTAVVSAALRIPAGATAARIASQTGLICEAHGGTLFLDELEALSLRAQVALLRFLHDASFRAVGEEHTRRADVRLIAASNVDLRRLVEAGNFREDLLFRIDVLPIQLPPLRDRAGDMALLVEHLLAKAACAEGGAAKSVSAEAMTLLEAHPWPGNVRELEHVLLRAHLLCDGSTIHAHDLVRCSRRFRPDLGVAVVADRLCLRDAKRQAVREIERSFVERALTEACGNISAAARMCNMQRAVLSKLAKKYGHADTRVAEVAGSH